MTKVTRLTLDSSGSLERRRLHLREIAEADAPLDTVGQDLRKARQRKGEDLAQISAILKIRKDHIEAIEESEFDALPGRTYAIGFVRTYANYLGLDAAQCIERLKAEIAGRVESKDGNVQLSPPEERKLPQGWLIFAAVLVIAVAYGGYYLVVSANRIAERPTPAVPERLAAEAAAPAQPQPAAPPPAAAPPPVAVAPPAQPAPAAPAAAPPSVAATVVPAVTPPEASSAVPPPLPAGQKYGAQNANSRITLRIHREGRVDVLGPNNRVYLGRVLKPGDTYRVPNLAGMTLSAADAGAVEVLVDGNSVGYAGQDGVAAESLMLNAQDIVERQRQAG
jgi:cytoskeleton protein RodZ